MKRELFNTGWSIQPVTGVFNFTPPDGQEVTLPHDAMIGKERSADVPQNSKSGYFPGGSCEYTKKLFLSEEEREKRLTLELEGCYNNTMVFVNGQLAGQCPYGYSNFYVSLNPYVVYGAENEIKVVARSGEDSRWYSGMGLYRDVRLLVGNPIHVAIDGLRVTTLSLERESFSSDQKQVTRAKLSVEVEVENEGISSQTVAVLAEVYAPSGELAASDCVPLGVLGGESSRVTLPFYIEEPQLWNVDTPQLYTCRIRLYPKQDRDMATAKAIRQEHLLDEEITEFGIRFLELDPFHGLRINGETVKLRGACIHHDNGVIGAATIQRAEERRVSILKEAGFNAIRSAHHPAGKALLSACDRLGMLVMDETFDMWTEQKNPYDYGLHFPVWWEQDVEQMVKKDYNHPSVILYSIGNEIPDPRTLGGNQWGRRIAETIKKLDSSRFTINSINGALLVIEQFQKLMRQTSVNASKPEETEETSLELNSMLSEREKKGNSNPMAVLTQGEGMGIALEEPAAAVDVAGYNYMTHRLVQDHEQHPTRILCGSETFSRDLAENWALVEEHPYILGDFCWTGWDYLGEAGIGKVIYPEKPEAVKGVYSSYPWMIANCGDIDILGNRRPISYYKELVWGLRKEPYIAVLRPEHYGKIPTVSPWSWSDSLCSWSFEAYNGKPVQAEVYAAGEEAELFLNGVSIGKKPIGERLPFLAEFELTYAPGTLTAVSYEKGEVIGEFTLHSAEGSVLLSVKPDRTKIKADTTDLAYLDITLEDADGNLYSSQDRMVKVTVEGAGHLQGLGSREPCTEEAFTGTSHTTYDGKALAVIRPDTAGTITVTVEAEGIERQVISIEAE